MPDIHDEQAREILDEMLHLIQIEAERVWFRDRFATALRAAHRAGVEDMRRASVDCINEMRYEGDSDLRQARDRIEYLLPKGDDDADT